MDDSLLFVEFLQMGPGPAPVFKYSIFRLSMNVLYYPSFFTCYFHNPWLQGDNLIAFSSESYVKFVLNKVTICAGFH